MKKCIFPFVEKWNVSFRIKLVTGFTILIGLIALSIIIIFSTQFEKQAINSLSDKAESINRMTAFSIGSALYFEDTETISEVISSVKQNKDVFYMIILDKDDTVVNGYNEKTEYFSEFRHVNDQRKISADGNILNTKVAIMVNQNEIGQLFMGFSLEDVNERVQNSALATSMLSFIISIFGILVVYGFSRLVTRPLEQMVNTVSQISPNNLSVRADINSEDEVGDLARSFNTMVGNLEQNTLNLEREIITRKEAEKTINASLKEKEILIKEIHHRVKNNLQVISSLLYLQSKSIENEEMLALFTESQGRVKSMALIHEKLYQGSDLANINFGEYIKNLASYLVNTYSVADRKIILNYQIEDAELDLDSAVPCGLIINELLTNSLKYAFPVNGGTVEHPDFKPEIKIDFLPKDDNLFTLKIGDNGCGIPEDFDLSKAKSLGLKLVSSLVQQIGGTVEIEHNEGVTFNIEFSKN